MVSQLQKPPYRGHVDDVAAAKARLRREIASRRAARSPEQRAADAEALARRVLALPDLRQPTTVTAYASFDTEPGTAPLLEALRQLGHRVLLPLMLPDRDLDWAHAGHPLGVDAIRQARVVVCPGLAADTTGVRLGRGGGSYDRALARCRDGPLRCVLLYDDEVLERVPHDDHDQPVDLIVTPRASTPADRPRPPPPLRG